MQDPTNEIRRMAKFLAIDLNEEQISIVRERTSFDTMKKKQDAATSDSDADAARKSMNLVRKGMC